MCGNCYLWWIQTRRKRILHIFLNTSVARQSRSAHPTPFYKYLPYYVYVLRAFSCPSRVIFVGSVGPLKMTYSLFFRRLAADPNLATKVMHRIVLFVLLPRACSVRYPKDKKITPSTLVYCFRTIGFNVKKTSSFSRPNQHWALGRLLLRLATRLIHLVVSC